MKALNTMILSMMLAASEAIAANGPYFLEATMTPADGIVKRGFLAEFAAGIGEHLNDIMRHAEFSCRNQNEFVIWIT